ncbi:RNA methylase [Gemmatirosa kalamazoonensis]|uniref:RNA methylase n=1 Tax=Gemmatirosa kalamazoonensis TaxID=861299 RepID=W0R913_9BACT|nr:RNA methyltransferase [Gemmatirosa kalamazoonensis]AHG87609.1 RNA methylase [Gemmatirosa kalamazoonensis]
MPSQSTAGNVTYDAFAITAPGLAPLAADELRALGVVPRDVDASGVSFDATAEQLWAANLWCRTVSRVVVRLAEFHATSFHELERHARKVAWERVTAPARAVRLRVTCRKSRLYHSDAVGERVADAIARRVGGAGGWQAAHDDEHESDDDGQLFVVRLFHDRCTVSADSSGALLHRRGYREALAKAPLRETLAAAALLAARWDPTTPLVDPMCGSGTIPIEAALLARRIAPGRQRRFAFEAWPDFEPARWRSLLARADAESLPAAPAPIHASDRDAGAVRATAENAARAGVAADVHVDRRPLSALAPPERPGWVVTNPPYGKRVGETDTLGALYARLGEVLRERCEGWTAALVSADAQLERRVGLRWHEVLRTTNGGIPIHVVAATVPDQR